MLSLSSLCWDAASSNSRACQLNKFHRVNGWFPFTTAYDLVQKVSFCRQKQNHKTTARAPPAAAAAADPADRVWLNDYGEKAGKVATLDKTVLHGDNLQINHGLFTSSLLLSFCCRYLMSSTINNFTAIINHCVCSTESTVQPNQNCRTPTWPYETL